MCLTQHERTMNFPIRCFPDPLGCRVAFFFQSPDPLFKLLQVSHRRGFAHRRFHQVKHLAETAFQKPGSTLQRPTYFSKIFSKLSNRVDARAKLVLNRR